MTVESTIRKQSYAGGQSALTFTFRALPTAPSDIKVVVVSSGTETLLTYTSQYTVTVSTDGVGGTVHVVPSFSTDYTYTVYRETTNKQESDYDDYNQFPADTVETDLDRRTMISQEIQEFLDRTVRVPVSSSISGSNLQLPAPSAGAALVWNSSGSGLTNSVYNPDTGAATALLYASSASTSATNAANSATTASTAATSAENSATTASTAATLAGNYATTASTGATDAANYASTASTQAALASNYASTASTGASTASTQAALAGNYASTASTQAALAGNYASTASTQATLAGNYATTASTAATLSGNYATTASTEAASLKTSAVEFFIDGGGATIPTGSTGWFELPFACTISTARLFANTTGSIKIDLWRDSYANYPPTDADTICGGNEPEISSDIKDEIVGVPSWSTSCPSGSVVYVNVDSCTTIQKCLLSLTVIRGV